MVQIAMPIYFPKPVTGQQIIDAVAKTIYTQPEFPGGRLVKDANWDADAEAYTIGRTSMHPAYQNMIKVGQHFSKEMVRPDGRYVSLAVSNAQWGGMVWCIGYQDETIVEAVKAFRTDLMKTFAEMLGIPLEEIVKKTAECSGSGVSDIRFVCSHCGTGFRVNPGSCTSCGAPLGNLLPVY